MAWTFYRWKCRAWERALALTHIPYYAVPDLWFQNHKVGTFWELPLPAEHFHGWSVLIIIKWFWRESLSPIPQTIPNITLKQQSKEAHPFLSFKCLETTLVHFISFYHPFSGVNISSTIGHVGWLPVHPLSFVTITTQCDPRHQMWSVQGRGQWIGSLPILGCYNISLLQIYLVGPLETSSSQSQLSPRLSLVFFMLVAY